MNTNTIVRRLTPVETSRLMGFPDDYLFIDGKDTPDSPVYKACGNSWGVNCARWVNLRIEKVLRECGAVGKDETINYATTCSGVEAHTLSVKGRNWESKFYSEIEPFPCRVLAKRYPSVPNLGDMTKVDGSEYKLSVFSGGTPCFVAGTMVLTPDGYKRIEELKVGDEVVSGTGKIQTVEAVGTKKAVVGELHIVGRPNFVCTPNHPFFAIDMKRDNSRKSMSYGKKTPHGDYSETSADSVVGKYVGRVKPQAVPNDADPTFVELAGWYVGDGYIRRFNGKSKKSVVFALCSERKISAFTKRFGGAFNLTKTSDGKVYINSTKLADFLVENFGEHADNKRIPYWLYSSKHKNLFMDGYRSTDGCERETNYKYTTVSKALAYGVADLIGNASIHFHATPDKHIICGREVNQKDYYVVQETKGGTRKTKLVNGRWASIASSWHCDGNTVEDVYNIQVGDEHTYIVEGIWSHNCQSFSVAGKRHGLGGSTSWDDTTTRSSLAFHWVRIGLEAKATVLLWENVPGVYSSSDGKDFPWLIHFLNDHGFIVAWRTLDVQYICTSGGTGFMNFARAIPQRRRRCWLVAYKGSDWKVPARILFERTSKLGSFCPDRVVGGKKMERKDGETGAMDLFGPSGPSFCKDSRADMIPFSEMPDEFVPAKVLQFMRKCGSVGFCGNIFKGEIDPEHIDKNLRENIGNAGIAKDGFIVTMKTPEWSAGIQLADDEECPPEYDGTVCGLSDVLEPMRDELVKYFLSSRACEGILKRADKRGKDLPGELEGALHSQIDNWKSGAFGDAKENTDDDDSPSDNPAEEEDGQ